MNPARQIGPVDTMVSIVMPSMNQAPFIAEAINSVLGQDHAHLELIVADGGSVDGTVALLERAARQDPRLRWTSAPDAGPAHALNKALRQARGTVIGWLNSDDVYTQGAVARAVAALDLHPHWLMLYGQGRHIDAQGGLIGDYPTFAPPTAIERFAQGCFICQPTVFMRRTLWLLLGDLDQGLATAFDFDYWLRVYKTWPGRVGFVDAVQAGSRLHDQCITVRMRRTVVVEGMRVLARHLGSAPMDWFLGYASGLDGGAGGGAQSAERVAHLCELLQEVRPCLTTSQAGELERRLAACSL